MKFTLTWPELQNPEMAYAINSLREDALRFLVAATAVGYAFWQMMVTVTVPLDDTPRYWAVFPFLVPGLVATSHLLKRHGLGPASICLLATAIVSITVAVWFVGSPMALIFYPLVTLAAVVLFHPLAGLLVSVASPSLLFLSWRFGLAPSIDCERLIETTMATLLTVAVAWILGHSLVVAVGWSLHSYEQALRNTREAQNHRARLLAAVKQLDNAYYRLQQVNAALDMAWKAAEAAERSKTEFATNISHELRTPLNLIVGFTDMMLSSPESYGVPLPAAYRVDLNAINRSAQHLLTLTNDVIDLTRVGIERLALVREPVDLEQVIKDSCEIIGEYVTVKGLRLRLEIQPNLPILHLDRLRIRQVLLNLLTNAARFTERGGITVSATLEAGSVVTKVTDTGHGIAEEDLPHVFDEFHTGGEDVPRPPTGLGGIGLGLPISKRLIELHGGEMGVDSAPGVGATFWFALPVTPADGAAHGSGWRPTRLSRAPAAGERVLVLAGAATRLAQFLQRHLRDYRVIAAPSLQRAVATAAEVQAIGILADAAGPDHLEELAAPLPVLRLPLPHLDRMASCLGAVACLVKPISRGELYAAIDRLGRPVQTVLVVDDDPSFVHLMTRVLTASPRTQKHEVLTAGDGREALAVMAATRPDLVLLDLVMPGMSGQELLATMRATPGLADVPVIVVSAQGEIESQVPLKGPVRLATPRGLQLEELLGVIEAVFGALRPTPPVTRGSGQPPLMQAGGTSTCTG